MASRTGLLPAVRDDISRGRSSVRNSRRRSVAVDVATEKRSGQVAVRSRSQGPPIHMRSEGFVGRKSAGGLSSGSRKSDDFSKQRRSASLSARLEVKSEGRPATASKVNLSQRKFAVKEVCLYFFMVM